MKKKSPSAPFKFMCILKSIFYSFTLLILLFSCNQEIKEESKTAELNPVTIPPASGNINFNLYKLTRAQILDGANYQTFKEAKTILIRFKFPEGSFSSDMQLLAYLAKNHTHFAVNGIPVTLEKTAETISLDARGIILGNLDMNWDYVKKTIWKGNDLDPEFDYLLLTPVIDFNKQLKYALSIFYNGSAKVSFINPMKITDSTLLPEDEFANPSPPAKPSN